MSCIIGGIIIFQSVYIEWIFGETLCTVYAFTVNCAEPKLQSRSVQDVFALCSINTLVVISVERFRLTVLPGQRPWTRKQAVVIIAVSYIVCVQPLSLFSHSHLHRLCPACG